MPSLSERSEQKRYLKMKKRKKIIRMTVLISAPIVVILMIAFYFLFQANRTYSGYEVVSKAEKIEGNDAKYIAYGDDLLKYSKDGACAMNMDGEILWNGSYDYEKPFAVTCGKYVAVADIGAKQISVFDGTEKVKVIQTEAAIEQISIAKQGVVAAILEENDKAKICIYNPYDAKDMLKVCIATSTDSDGYPVSIALSKDGQKLVTSYINISNGVISSSLNFYNFDNVGKNRVDRIVGSRPLGTEIVADIQFLNDSEVVAFTKNGFYVYKMKETPVDVAKIKEKSNIKSVSYNDEYIALVTENDKNPTSSYIAKAYTTSGKKVLEKEIGYSYNQFLMGNKELIFYSSTEGHILRFRGSEKLDCEFDSVVSYLFPIQSSSKYCLIDGDYIKQISLTGRKKEK